MDAASSTYCKLASLAQAEAERHQKRVRANFARRLTYLMNHRSLEADYACLEQVELSSPIHLPLDELELAYVAFGLAVGP
jgi:hypothetical protein